MTTLGARIFLCGDSESGKTTLLRDYFLPAFPRALLVDQLGECWDWPGVEVVSTTAAAIRALAQGHARVVLTVRDRDTEWAALAAALVPLHPSQPALSQAVPGLVLACNEMAMLTPNGETAEVWEDVYRRGRHLGLSLLAATQRPADVSRVVTAQSPVLACCQLSEPRDLAYMATILPKGAQIFPSIPRYGAIQWEKVPRRATLLAPRTPPPGATWAAVATYDDRAGGGWQPT